MLPTDDIRIIDILRGVKRKQRIVVYIIVKLLRTHTEAGNNTALIPRLHSAGNRAGFNKIYNRISEHLGVYAKVLFFLQKLHHCLRNSSYPELYRRFIIDQCRDVFTHLSDILSRHRRNDLDERRIHRNEHINIIYINKTAA